MPQPPLLPLDSIQLQNPLYTRCTHMPWLTQTKMFLVMTLLTFLFRKRLSEEAKAISCFNCLCTLESYKCIHLLSVCSCLLMGSFNMFSLCHITENNQ